MANRKAVASKKEIRKPTVGQTLIVIEGKAGIPTGELAHFRDSYKHNGVTLWVVDGIKNGTSFFSWRFVICEKPCETCKERFRCWTA